MQEGLNDQKKKMQEIKKALESEKKSQEPN